MLLSSYRPRVYTPFLAIVACCSALQLEAAPPERVSESDTYKVIYSVDYSDPEKDAVDSDTQASSRLRADLYLPKGSQRFPTILMIHGGAWFSGNKAHVSMHARYAAEAGYAVLAVNYRLAPQHKFPAQLEDLRTALHFIARKADEYRFDTDRVAAYGYSAGGHLAALLGVTQNAGKKNLVAGVAVKAVVAGGSPCEFSWIADDSERLSFWLGGSRIQKPRVYLDASPTSFVDKQDPPFFFFHGKSDGIVPIQSARKLNRLLTDQRVTTQFFVVPEAGHLGAFVNSEARAAAIKFLNQQLDIAE